MDQLYAMYQSCWTATEPLQWQHRNLADWKQWAEWLLSCHVWNAARVFRLWFSWPSRHGTGIHHCHCSRPRNGTNATPTDAPDARRYDKCETVSNAEVCKRQTFFRQKTMRSCGLRFQVPWVTEIEGSSFPCSLVASLSLVPSLVVGAWILIGDVWNLVG